MKIDYKKLKKTHWSRQEDKNVRLVIDFVQHLMNNHDFTYVRNTFSNDAYVQHNRNIPDGMSALIDYVQSFAQRFPDYVYDVKHIYADGDHVIFHSHITTKKKHRGDDSKGINVIDTWRLNNGQIVEHWDALQALNPFMRFYFWLVGGKLANRNGVF